MKKLIIFIVLSMCIISNISAQTLINETIIKVNFETQTDFSYQAYFTKMYDGDQTEFKGIPSKLTTENRIIKRIHFGSSVLPTDTFFVLIGDLSEQQRICIIDANRNKDFSDDYVYAFDKDKISDKTFFPSQPVKIGIIKDSLTTYRVINISPFFKGNMKFTNPIEQKFYVFISSPEYKIGYSTINHKKYMIILTLDKSEPNKYLITDSIDINYNKKILFKQLKSISESSVIGDYLVSIKSFETYNSAAYLNIGPFKNINNANSQGSNVGLYAFNIEDTDINGKKINLKDYLGKYVLLDFWGTWCKPCIELIPHIAELHVKYNELKIISLASCETDMSHKLIPDLVKKHQMDWVNLCDYDDVPGTKPWYIYHISAYPTTILINPEGRIIYRGNTAEIPQLKRMLGEIFKK